MMHLRSLLAGIAISWDDCGAANGATAKITNVVWSPQNPSAGDNVTITATGTMTKTITKMNGELEFAGGLIKKSFDGCAGGTVKAPLNLAVITFPPAGCPLSPPNLKSVRYVAISNNLPKGKTKSTLKVSDQDGAAFACVDITLSNTADEDEKAASHLR